MMVSESQEMYSGCQWIMETIRKNENIYIKFETKCQL